MPNWCHNTLTVSGAGVAEFAEKVKVSDEQPLSFAVHLPVPNEDEWYAWCIANWGTKWDANFGGAFIAALASEEAGEADLDAQTGVATMEGLVIYKFTTAWGPPVEWLGAVSEMEPELEFKLVYAEPGGDFAGEAIAVAGQLEETGLDVEEVLTPEEMWF